MTSTAQDILEQVLEKGGFVQRGTKSSGLINAENVKNTATTDLRYGHLFDRRNDPVVDLVYEVPSQSGNHNIPGTPSIYFKVLEEASPEAIIKLRSQVWNQGRAPTLWIVTSNEVRIYDSYARQQKDESDRDYLLEEFKNIGGQVPYLNAFHKKNFDTGEFWQSKYGKKIKQHQRVDKAMLDDLSVAESRLLEGFKERGFTFPIAVAHALLGRSIFASYLEDRHILTRSFFEEMYGYSSFKALLSDRDAAYTFFRWLRETFNGNLFPFHEEEEKVRKPDLEIVWDFLAGIDVSKDSIRRPRLWGYEFDFIPIELISSIYEMFAHSSDSQAAEERSTHYTRIQLVELVLSLAMADMKSTARILDPACGSGIFLVEAFKRLVWLREREHERGYVVQRDELRGMLYSQIFGIDIDRGAVDVSAFSLYLTLLELDPDPQPPAALRFLPLLPSDEMPDKIPNLYVQDFCNTEHFFNRRKPFVNRDFDLIVSNPPWTALKDAKAPRDPDNPISGRQWSLEYCKTNAIPDRKPDQAFVTRVRDFTSSNTQVALVVSSRMFYQQEDKSWLGRFLSSATIDTVINLSDLVGEKILFGDKPGKSSTKNPASAIFFRAFSSSEDNQVRYITPKWYPGIKTRGEIIISSEDIQYLSQRLLQSKPFLWKSVFRGTPRDYRLLSRLQRLPSLGTVLSEVGLLKQAHRDITFGEGKKKKTPPELLGKPFLPSKSVERYHIDVDPLPLFEWNEIAKRSNTKYLQLPALVLWRSLKHQGKKPTLENAGSPYVALAEETAQRHHLVIDQLYYGIPSSSAYPTLLYRLNAILNSKLAFYMAFMFGSVLGWGDHWLVEERDWLQVRLPDFILDNDTTPLWDEILQREQWLRGHWRPDISTISPTGREIAQEQRMLEQAIFQLYDLSKQEILLVEDTIAYGINPILTRDLRQANASLYANTNDLQKYARRLCKQLNGVLSDEGQELIAFVVEFKRSSPLRACRFRQGDMSTNEMATVVQFEGIDDVVEQMAQDLRTEIADRVYIQRSLHVYEHDGFWIIKSAEKRLWSESAALNDADMIVCEHMEDTEDE